MLQFYFLSIFCNLAAGALLFFDEQTENIEFLKGKTFRLVLGLVTAIVGVLKLFVVAYSNSKVFIFGDFIPAVAGIAGGFTFLLSYYMDQSTTEVKLPEFLQKIFVVNANVLGIFCMAAALLHFLFPRVLFL